MLGINSRSSPTGLLSVAHRIYLPILEVIASTYSTNQNLATFGAGATLSEPSYLLSLVYRIRGVRVSNVDGRLRGDDRDSHLHAPEPDDSPGQ